MGGSAGTRASIGRMAFLEVAGGAIVGGAISSVTTWWNDWRAAKREDEKAEERSHRERRRAARLVEDELRKIRTFPAIALEAEGPFKWPPKVSHRLPTSVWDQYQGLLTDIPDDQWETLIRAYASVYFLNHETEEEPEDIDREGVRADVDRFLREMDDAISVCTDLAAEE
jgi:hypothetical protein